MKDFGRQALIRWLASAFSCMRSGANPILQRASALSATKRVMDIPCCGPAPACPRGLRCLQVGCTSRATAHMKPASSWHMMVAVVLPFPFRDYSCTPGLFEHTRKQNDARVAESHSRSACLGYGSDTGKPQGRLQHVDAAVHGTE